MAKVLTWDEARRIASNTPSRRRDLEPFAFAGVWEFTRPGGDVGGL
jgi:hypothetical protein